MRRSYQDPWNSAEPRSGVLVSLAFSAIVTVALSGFAAEPAKLFHRQYHIADSSFCYAQGCVDFNGDGRRELLFASRGTGELQMLNAADGTVRWSRRLAGQQQSISIFDLNGDGNFEIVYTVSSPGRLYVLDHHGTVLRQWDSGDWKLGNSPVVIDGNGDGVLDGYFGTRGKDLIRLNMLDLSVIVQRTPWIQCGCHISAMDVDRNGRWDLFAGSGDDRSAQGVLHRLDPVTLESVWSYDVRDNASSADPVLADITGDGRVEIIKSVDNYAGDEAHDGVYAFKTDGTLLWKVAGLAGEDSPNVADLNGDGQVEIVGMTFGGDVYCLDASGEVRWRRDLRPEVSDKAHAYMTPILCDLNGDGNLEILAMTNGPYFDKTTGGPHGILFALSADGEILDQFDVGGPRFWGEAYVANVDDDPFLSVILSGSGGLDVIKTRGFGPNTEHFQRRRCYRRLNVLPWAYEDSYFMYRGHKENVENLTDNLVLAQEDGGHRPAGRFTTELLTLPPGCAFTAVDYDADIPGDTELQVNLLSRSGNSIRENVADGTRLKMAFDEIAEPLQLEFLFKTSDRSVSPKLNSYRLSFEQAVSE